jgi:hypothetical protein
LANFATPCGGLANISTSANKKAAVSIDMLGLHPERLASFLLQGPGLAGKIKSTVPVTGLAISTYAGSGAP